MIPASERAKAVHALDRAATVTGEFNNLYYCKIRTVFGGNYKYSKNFEP
jgi:hypothetical protein